MSTRAIITVKSADGKDVRRLYAHGDGYPSTVGMMVYNFANVARAIDVNAGGGKVRKAAFGDWNSKNPAKREGNYGKWSPLGQAYATMANTSVEPDKFIPALITFMTSKGYGGLYLTDRDPDKEAASKGNSEEFGTDIEWHYVVTLGKDFGVKPKVEAYKSVDYGPRKPLYRGQNGKVVTIGSLQKFVKRGPIPQLAAKEYDEQRKRIAEYEKEQKGDKDAEKDASSPGKGTLIETSVLEELDAAKKGNPWPPKKKSHRGQPGTRNYIKGLKGLS